MALIERLAGLQGENKLAAHQFYAALLEFAEGAATRAQLVSFFGMDATDEADLDYLVARYQAQPNDLAKVKFLLRVEGVFLLAEDGTPGYTSRAEVKAIFDAI